MNLIKLFFDQEAMKITWIWSAAGLSMFLFELLFRLSYDFRSDLMLAGSFYVVPPLIFGYPFCLASN